MEFGWIYEPQSFMQDDDLRVPVASTWSYDWVHVYLSDGVFTKEMDQCLELLKESSLGFETFNMYLDLWDWPRAYPAARGLCDKKDSASGTASQFLFGGPRVPQVFARRV